MQVEYPDCIRCERHCSDCCHAVFGLFLIEAAYLQQRFRQLDEVVREKALERGRKLDQDLKRLEEKVRTHENDPKMQGYVLARERIRCPLLDEKDDCILYPHRPVTCRVYGIPTSVQGKARVCGKAAFEGGRKYPVFDLDGTHRDLHMLSREVLEQADKDPEKASLLISVSKAIHTPLEDLVSEIFG
jgi:Fe-S-cluster containining protein